MPRPVRLRASRGRRACPPGPRRTRAARRSLSVVRPIDVVGLRARDLADQRLRRGDGARAPRQDLVHVAVRRPRRARLPARPSWTSPISRARAAPKRAPVRNSSRAAETPILREHERRDHRRQDAELDLGEPEHRIVGGDDDVADRGEPDAAAERRAVDRGRSAASAACRARSNIRASSLGVAQVLRRGV